MKLNNNPVWSRIKASAAGTCMLAILAGGALPGTATDSFAQQQGRSFGQQGTSELGVPGSQQQGGATLELPASRNQGQLNIPPPSPPQQELVIPSRQLREKPGYEQVTVTVTDSRGSYVTGLNKDDFRLYLDGQQRPIEFFRRDLNTPVSVGIVADTSGSMVPKLVQARLAIAQFLRDLNDRDDVFLFAFSSRPFLLQAFTTDHSLVMRRLALLHAYGQTALFDAVLDALVMVQHGRYDKKALLVITDGMDNTSMHTLDDVVARARRQGVLIYSIGIGDPNASPMSGLALGPFVFGGDSERVDAQTLKMLSSETGARTYLIRQVGDGVALRDACANISNELREQYTVGFVAPDPSAGRYRSIHVEVPDHPSDSVRVRKGIEIGSSRPTSADSSLP